MYDRQEDQRNTHRWQRNGRGFLCDQSCCNVDRLLHTPSCSWDQPVNKISYQPFIKYKVICTKFEINITNLSIFRLILSKCM